MYFEFDSLISWSLVEILLPVIEDELDVLYQFFTFLETLKNLK